MGLEKNFETKIQNIQINNLLQNIFDQVFDTDADKDKEPVAGIKECQTQFEKIYKNNSSYFSITSLSNLLSEEFSDIFHELADNISAEVEFHVNWNLDTKSRKRDLFSKEMKDLFIDEPDHNCIDALLKQKSTLVLTIQIKKELSKESTIIAFALITLVKKCNLTVLVIVDYFGVIEMCPRHIIPTFDYERFRGKGIGKFIIHMIQAIANVLCESKDGIVLLKCNEDVSTFYETIGFERIDFDNDVMKVENVIQHYKDFQLFKSLFSYILKSSTKINHKKNTFVNHVEQSLKDVDFNFEGNTSIVTDVHNIFMSPKKFDKMKELSWRNIMRSEFVFIPIEKIIQKLSLIHI